LLCESVDNVDGAQSLDVHGTTRTRGGKIRRSHLRWRGTLHHWKGRPPGFVARIIPESSRIPILEENSRPLSHLREPLKFSQDSTAELKLVPLQRGCAEPNCPPFASVVSSRHPGRYRKSPRSHAWTPQGQMGKCHDRRRRPGTDLVRSTLEIFALASRAFAFYYLLQCLVAVSVSKSRA
jgi:hypothetical protein